MFFYNFIVLKTEIKIKNIFTQIPPTYYQIHSKAEEKNYKRTNEKGNLKKVRPGKTYQPTHSLIVMQIPIN